MDSNLWFKRKLYGWGWTPATWQGWLVVGIWALFFTFSMLYVNDLWLKNLIIFISIIILLAICYKKGEPPKWQWGKRRE